MHWNIADFLPELICQEQFEIVVSKWIYETCLTRLAARKERGGPGHTPIKARHETPKERSAEASEASASAVVIRDIITDGMMKVVVNIGKLVKGDASVHHSDAFPELAGSHLKVNNPALEFIKSVCAVFAIDESAADEAAKLRKNLLKIIRVREFCEDAQFKDPCLSFVLNEVICEYCNKCRDFDLCRDKELTAESWQCSECYHDFNKAAIEQRLIEYVNKRSMAFQLQDLVWYVDSQPPAPLPLLSSLACVFS